MTSTPDRRRLERAKGRASDEDRHGREPGGPGICSIAGIIYGDIRHRGRIVLEASALVIGDVSADDVVVSGAVTGSVRASKSVIVTAGASVGCELVACELDIDRQACVVPSFVHRLAEGDSRPSSAGSAPGSDEGRGHTEWPVFVG